MAATDKVWSKMPFKSKSQQRYMFLKHPKIAKEFSKKTDFKNLPEKIHLSDSKELNTDYMKPQHKEIASSASTDALFKEDVPKKMSIACAVETAEHYVKKEWNTKKGRFDYIYPKDIEKKGRKEAKENLQASEKGDIPKKLQLKGVPKLSKLDKEAVKESLEHPWMDMEDAKKVAKDHAETADDTPSDRKAKQGDYKGGKKGRSWNWDDHKYRVRAGPKGDYRYNYSQNQKVPHTEAVVERKQKKERERQESRAAHEGGKVRLPISGELQNPGAQASRPTAGFRGRAPSPRLPSQSRGRHMQNVAVKANDVNIKGMMEGMNKQGSPPPTQQQQQPQAQAKAPTQGQVPASVMLGAGQHVQSQGIGNPMNTGQNMVPAKQRMQGSIQNTMVDQAKAQGNVYDSRTIGYEDVNKQNSSINPLSPDNLTPEQQQRMGQAQQMAQQMAMKTGGQSWTTAGRSAGVHTITIHPNRTVFDPVLGVNDMPLDRYLSLIPYSFAPSA